MYQKFYRYHNVSQYKNDLLGSLSILFHLNIFRPNIMVKIWYQKFNSDYLSLKDFSNRFHQNLNDNIKVHFN